MLKFPIHRLKGHFLSAAALLLVMGVCLFPAREALAQSNDATAFTAQRFRPWHDPNGLFQSDSGKTLGKFKYTVGLLFNYAKDPLVLRTQDGARINGGELIGNQFAADLTFGFGILNFLDVYLAIPMTIFQTGGIPSDPQYAGNFLQDDVGKSTDGFFLGDIKLGVKGQILREKKHFLNLALRLILSLPTSLGGAKKYFNGEDGVSIDAGLMVSKNFGILDLVLNFGYRYMPKSDFLSLVLQHELNYSLGVSVHVIKNRLDIIGELAGAATLEEAKTDSAPFDLLFGVRIFPLKNNNALSINVGGGIPFYAAYGSPQFRVFAGVMWAPRDQDTDKDGLMDSVDKCPKVYGPKENQGCPWGDRDGDGLKDNVDKCPDKVGPKENKGCPWPDTDGDGLTDNVDKCPKKKGPKSNNGCPWGDRDGDGLKDNVDKCPDKAGPKENKGCPWPDTDGDGVLDKDDRCPKKKGPKEFKGCPDSDKDKIPDPDDKCPYVPGVKERNGCPKVVLVKVTKKSIQILKKIFFRTGSARIRRRSYPVLNQVVTVLKNFPKIRVRVEGHTDNVGSKKYNKGLSQRRAKSVRRFLMKKGIDAGRLESEGYGMEKPLVPNNSRKNRAKNRRVEFNIISQ
ncbi:MAG: hypothetical protein CL920_08320 [Deltaproteobacteria bacterium]|nr:hypothetical protein [Deltaproteobacteria bacterium]|tara:strand:+ start:41112 stop:42983 length:1872 start_codon:yes stop_codon:yes gene_type:complete